MADEENPFDAVRAILLENLEKVLGATQSYIGTFGESEQGLRTSHEQRRE